MSSKKCFEALCVSGFEKDPLNMKEQHGALCLLLSAICRTSTKWLPNVFPPYTLRENSFCEAEVNEWMRDRTVVDVDGADRNKKIGRFSLRRSQLEITRLHSSSSFLTESIRFSV